MNQDGADSRDERIDVYAGALFEISRAEGSLARVEEELFRVARTFESNDDLRAALTDPSIPMERRLGIVEDLLVGRASSVTKALVEFMVGVGRAKYLPGIVDGLVAKAAEERDQQVAEVRAAIPLDADRRDRLASALGRATGKNVSVKVVVDPTILGGVVAQVGDTVIDGSVRHRLEQLKVYESRAAANEKIT